jgi:acetyl esterase/lipase
MMFVSMDSKLQDDPRIDPRIKKAFGQLQLPRAGNVISREALLAQEHTPAAQASYASMLSMMEAADSEAIAPSAGLRRSEHTIESAPDGNKINLLLIRPVGDDPVACVYYMHGGAMQILSCFNGTYRAWARMIAAHGVAVVMVDFRNCVLPSSAPEVAPYPAGLNDCVSGLRWLHGHARGLGIDAGRIIVAGESGGANLAIATALRLKREGNLAMIQGIYGLCPYIAGEWPLPQNPSSVENNAILDDYHNNRGRMAYGIEAFRARDPLAWPGFASEEDVRGLPPVAISVNECDPFRDEGINFYRLLIRAGVSARCRQNMGLTHGAEVFPLGVCLDVSRDTASQLASFAQRALGNEVAP